MDLGPGLGCAWGKWAFAKVPAWMPSRQMHPSGIWEAFPGVLGGMQRSQPSLVSWEAALVSPGQAGCGLPALSQSILQARRILNILRGLCAQLARVLWPGPCTCWWCQGREREGGVDLPSSQPFQEETGREHLLGLHGRKRLVQMKVGAARPDSWPWGPS